MKKFKLLWLVITSVISFKYWWNYKNANAFIHVLDDTVDIRNEILSKTLN